VPAQCEAIQDEIDTLKKEKYTDAATLTIKTLTGSYPYGGEEKQLDQKIKILELKLNTCQRR
jgi:hypothetical protein